MLHELSSAQSNFLDIAQNSKIMINLTEEETCEIEKLFENLAIESSEAFGNDVQQLIALLQFLLKTFSYFHDVGSTPAAINTDLEKVIPILQYIQANLTEPLTVEAIASHFFISKYHLCHIFKPATGFGVMDYVIHCRILRARELLRNGMQVQECGERVGFRNNEHFIRTFKKLTGTSPKKYAKKYLTTDNSIHFTPGAAMPQPQLNSPVLSTVSAP